MRKPGKSNYYRYSNQDFLAYKPFGEKNVDDDMYFEDKPARKQSIKTIRKKEIVSCKQNNILNTNLETSSKKENINSSSKSKKCLLDQKRIKDIEIKIFDSKYSLKAINNAINKYYYELDSGNERSIFIKRILDYLHERMNLRYDFLDKWQRYLSVGLEIEPKSFLIDIIKDYLYNIDEQLLNARLNKIKKDDEFYICLTKFVDNNDITFPRVLIDYLKKCNSLDIFSKNIYNEMRKQIKFEEKWER